VLKVHKVPKVLEDHKGLLGLPQEDLKVLQVRTVVDQVLKGLKEVKDFRVQ
jgi:hypothetical protein